MKILSRFGMYVLYVDFYYVLCHHKFKPTEGGGEPVKQCKLCKRKLQQGQSHSCPNQEGQTISYDDDSFMLSLAVAAATDSATLGLAAGGNLGGALLGDALNSGDDSGGGDSGGGDSGGGGGD